MRKILFCTISRTGSHIILRSLENQVDTELVHAMDIDVKDFVTDREVFYLERKDFFQWALTNIYNEIIFNKIKDDCNVWNTTQQDYYYQKQVEIFTEPTLLTPLHFKPLLYQIKKHNQMKNKYPSKFPTLYYEDLCVDPAKELAKWNFEFYPEKSSVKIKKIPYDQVFLNIDEARKLWYYIFEKLCPPTLEMEKAQ